MQRYVSHDVNHKQFWDVVQLVKFADTQTQW